MFVISFKVTEEAKAAIEAVADGQGLAPAIWCRMIVLREADAVAEQPRVVRRVANRDVLREALAELGRQGGLLNQVARRLNGGGSASAAAAELAVLRTSYNAALRALTSALGVGETP